jgi:UDP-N-acetylmuramoyl-tripeptide--D-alanyl-D-alanine ligase
MQAKTPFVKINFLDQQIQSQLIGAYNFSNIAAAISIGHYFELDFLKIKKGIESYQPKNNRSQIIKQKSNTIILDAYNANPTSMNAALDNFSLMKGDNKIVILGDMFELGDESSNEHKAVIDLVNSLNFSFTYYVGQHFIKHKFLSETVFFFDNTDVLKRHFQSLSISNSVILVKGSRGMSLEVLLQYL